MNEKWKPVKGYEELYEVSNMGRVKSLNYNHTGKERILKSCKNSAGYLIIELYKNGIGKCYTIHRLVAEAFIPNIDNLPDINHKDENKANNYVNNLEWCTTKYNINYGTAKTRIAEKMTGRKLTNEHIKKIAEKNTNNPKISKPVIGINKVSGLIVEFPSAREAERQTGINHGNIAQCCKGKYKSAGGFLWFYAE